MIKILIIDENNEQRSYLKEVLINSTILDDEIDVYEASNGLEGLKMAQYNEPNIVILEQQLKEIDGITLCKELASKKDIPIIFLTAIRDNEIKEQAFRAGASDYLIKPTHPYELLIRIKKHYDFYMLQKKLKDTLENYEKDIKIARIVQKGLLPKNKKNDNVVFDYIYISSHYTSGDMLDVIQLDDDKVFVYVYDISGHGVTSALLSIIVKQEIEQIIKEEYNLKDIVLKLEKRTKEHFFDGRYFTGIFAIISKNEIEYINIAHREMIFLKNREIEIDSETDFPMGVGLIHKDNLHVHKKKIDNDTMILLYTDGLLEVKDFDENSLYNLLSNIKNNDPEDIMHTIRTAINLYLDYNYPNDDITVLGLKIL
ncbi:fused response regulator/phosphatase [Marinitoga litoralis]|uniref:fused response regulator/phosphatase n=1 Tax=Marinitoga litoralis TaxID=570855 RepID=UPI0019606707|nr:fused response regulator/phosphatase [Marinitoga litoralis]MBM7559690.1 sigma-B regulation protein RsbU (phosphoserine phosphatase) [Marinitoga litoralis]